MAGIKRVLEALRRETPVLTRQAEDYPVLRSQAAGDTPVDPTGIPISALPGADTPNDNDVFAIVQDDTTKKSRLGALLAWIKGQLSTSDIGAQGEILVSGILKGNGVGGISAAQPGTDYGTYSKPSGGIPSTDMTSAVQTSLGKADTAYQKPSGGIPASDLANGVIPTVPSASTATPQMDGAASPGSTGEWADGGHVHPTDTTRAAAALEINGHPLTGDFDLTAADVGALASGGTAVTARKLSNAHVIDTTNAVGWYKFFEISMANFTRQTLVICIESTYDQQCSILRINTYRTSAGTSNQSIGWIAAGSRHHSVRWDCSDGVWSFYIYKTDNINTLVFQMLARNNDNYGTWSVTAVSEPTSAFEVNTLVDIRAREAVSDGNGNNIAESVLRFSSVAVSAGTAQQIMSISDAKITADYVLVRIEFADPSYITTGYSWATSAGSFTLTGTATAATTADVLLVRKGN